MKPVNGDLKIEKGIPLPPPRRAGGTVLAALRSMKVGESFLYDKNNGLANMAARAGVKIATRKEGGQYRVWRTA